MQEAGGNHWGQTPFRWAARLMARLIHLLMVIDSNSARFSRAWRSFCDTFMSSLSRFLSMTGNSTGNKYVIQAKYHLTVGYVSINLCSTVSKRGMTMQKLLDWLAVLIRPRYWLTLYPYSRFWDEKLRELMSEHDFVVLDKWTAQLGPVKVWIENMPYAAFTLYTLDTPGSLTVKQELRASRATIYRAAKKLRRDSGISGHHIGPERTIRKIFDDIESKPSLKVVK